jgi:hypothetical protein
LLGALGALISRTILNFLSEIIKSHLSNKDKNIDEKRKTYIQLINSMGIFIEGKFQGDLYKTAQVNFNVAYDYAWLWGNIKLIQELGSYLDKATELTDLENRKSEKESLRKSELIKEMEIQHFEIILLMREDLGLENKDIFKEDYRFFKLS